MLYRQLIQLSDVVCLAITYSTMEINSLSTCTYETCPISLSTYGYRPNQGVSVIFLISFLSSFIGLQIIIWYAKQWLRFSIPLCVVCLFEVVGYAARIRSWNNPWDVNLYAATEFFLTIAPTMVTTRYASHTVF